MVSLNSNFNAELELNFFPEQEFESTKNVEYSKAAPIIARNVLRFLMMGWSASWTEFLTLPLVKAVFVKRNPQLLKELRFAFQQGFYELFEQLKGKKLTIQQKEQVHLYLSNCLTLLPYADLTPYESMKIPQYIHDDLEMVEYRITPIELTNTTGWRRFFISDSDRVFAYGLEPLFHDKAESHLIFMGTTYPAGQGFFSQVNTDLKGFETVGKSLYRTGRAKVQQWLSQQNNSIHVCGISLGGSLSLLLAIDSGDYVLSRVDALNPAGLHNAWRQSQYDKWDSLICKPKVVVQKQCNDPVSEFGIWKKDWLIIHVQAPKDKRGPNRFCDHFLNYAGFANTTFSYIEAESDNSKRKALNFWLYSLGRGFLYYAILVPFTYIVRPIINFISQNIFFSILIAVAALAGIFAGILPGLVFLGIASMILTYNLGLINFSPIKKSLNKTNRDGYLFDEIAEMHDPSLLRNLTMDIYHPSNEVELNLTRGQIHTYFQVMRLVKKKDFLPDHEKESKHVKGVTKKMLLEECMDFQKKDVVLPFRVTKAKAIHINQTLKLISKVDNEEKVLGDIEKSYETYRLGKQSRS